MIWGATFLIIQLAMQHSGPLFFVGLRFLTAGLISAVLFRRALAGMTRQDLRAGLLIGSFLFAGYGLQTYGLQTISSSQSAFITAMYVPAVPLLQWLVWRRPPSFMNLVGVALAFCGLILLAGPTSASLHMSLGEWATLLGALAVAAEIILIGHYAGKVNLRRVTTLQLLVAGILAWLLMPLAGENIPAFSWVWLSAAVGLGAASCLIQLTMNWAQKDVSPTRATLIYASEPIWAGIIGRIAGDRLPGVALFGGALIVLGVISSELKLRRRKKPSR
ncbi:DMT family transporter [Pusillimonas sp. CC-YST705]|uniref:DMT family transporter n=2 Tax=Mesopusillimonas faecipullorum TaxID=2755040 RepID=A0ABS8C8R2_9BURK|nr:DMT family transporter [Mesopusillimonas faecipullorum]